MIFNPILFAICLLASTVVANVDPLHVDRLAETVRSLTAITTRSNLNRRDVAFTPKTRCEHHYVDKSSLLHGEPARFAKTSMKLKMPAVTLEDIDHHLRSITCLDNSVVLKFDRIFDFKKAQDDWSQVSNMFIISSHTNCNPVGARTPHAVYGITFDVSEITATFLTREIEWHHTYETVEVEFGMALANGEYSVDGLHGGGLRKRQTTSSTSSAVAYPLPTSPPAQTSANKSIAYQVPQDTEIYAHEFKTGSVTETIALNCKDCHTTGSIEITSGSFVVDGSPTSSFGNATTKAMNFVKYGYFVAKFNGFSAHVELEATLDLKTTKSLEQTIVPTIFLPAFAVGSIFVVGPEYGAALFASVAVGTKVGFSSGFQLVVKDGSNFTLNFGNASNSKAYGFSQTATTLLPFNINNPSINLDFSIGLTSEVGLTIKIPGGLASATANLFLDLPVLDVAIKVLSGVNLECNNITSSSTANTLLDFVFPKLITVVPSMRVDVGAGVRGEVDLPGPAGSFDIGASTTLAGKSAPLPTKCYAWDPLAKKLAAPVVPTVSTVSTVSGLPTAGAGKDGADGDKNGQAVKTPNGDSAACSRVGEVRVVWTAVGLVFVLLIAACL